MPYFLSLLAFALAVPAAAQSSATANYKLPTTNSANYKLQTINSPASSTRWTHAGWGGGGYFWAAEFDPADADTLYLAGDVAGLYKSTDRALSWRMINSGIQNYAVYALAVAPSNPQVVYAMTVDGMARSDNGGASWKPLAETRKSRKNISATRGSTVRAIAVDPRDHRVVYAGSGGGALYKSADAGETWKALAFSETTEPAVASVVIAGDALFVCHRRQGIFRSGDGGATWTPVSGAPRNAAHISFLGSRVAGAFARDGVWLSDDAGATWRKAAGATPPSLDIREVALDPRDARTIHFIAHENWSGCHGVSRDGGAVWTLTRGFARDSLSNPALPGSFGRTPEMSRVSSLALAPSAPNSLFIAGNWNNILSADSGRAWAQRDNGTDITCFTDLRFIGGSAFATAMDQGLFRSDDNGATWRHLYPLKYKEGENGHQWRVLARLKANGGANAAFRILSTSTPWRGAREYPNTILISDDNGATFSAAAAGLPDFIPKANTMWGEGYARALAADPRNPDVLYLGIDGDSTEENEGGGIFKSTDGGLSWARLPAQPGSRRVFYGLAVDPRDSRRIYWGACGDNAGVWLSEDGGENWQKTPLTEWIFNIEASPSGGALYAGGSDLWQSLDGATTWRKLTDFKKEPRFGGGSIVGIAIDPEDEHRIWISMRTWGTNSAGGIFRTADGGESWSEITGDLPYIKPMLLRYNPATRELWAAGTGMFKTRQ